MKVGEVVKHIRMSKRLKSANVYTDILSRPAISRFEKGLSDTTSDKLFKILANLNVSLDEFHFIYTNYNQENDFDFLKKYSHAFYLNDLESLKKLQVSTEQKYNRNSQLKQLHYSTLCNLTISYITNKPSDMNCLNVLKDYLLECDEWTYYELVLFTNSLDFFSEDLILLLYKRTKKKLDYFGQLRKYNNEVFSLISNILVVFIIKNDLNQSTYFYKELKLNLSETNNKMYEKTMLIFFKELISAMKSKQLNITIVDTIIALFKCLDMPLKTNQCSKLVGIVKKNNQIK